MDKTRVGEAFSFPFVAFAESLSSFFFFSPFFLRRRKEGELKGKGRSSPFFPFFCVASLEFLFPFLVVVHKM